MAFKIIALLFIGSNTLAAFSKQQAREQLMQTGVKWKMTQTLLTDAQAKKDQAASTFNPKTLLVARQYYSKINPIQYGGENRDSVDQVGFGTTAVEFEWTLLDPLAKGELIISENALQMTHEKTQNLQNDLTALMLLQYLNVQRLTRQMNLMNSNLAKSELILKLAKAKKSVGAGIQLDVSRARNLYQLDKIKKFATKNKLMKAENELATTLGLDQLPLPLDELESKVIPIEETDAFYNTALQNRPDLRTAQADLATSERALNYTSGTVFPKLNLIADVGSTRTSVLGMPPKTLTGFFGVGLTIPIDSGGAIQAKKAEALSAETKASLQVQQIKLEMHQQAREAIEQMQSAQEALEAALDYYNTTQEEARIAETRFNNGASNILDYTNAHTNLSNAADTLTESIYNYEAAKLNYFRTKGSMSDYFQSI